jgi:hypothetical protein
MCPIAQADRHDCPRQVDEAVPGKAAVIDDVVIGLEDARSAAWRSSKEGIAVDIERVATVLPVGSNALPSLELRDLRDAISPDVIDMLVMKDRE